MTRPSEDWRETAARVVGAPVTGVRALSGGCVGEVYRVTFADAGPLVAKVGGPASGLALEGWMLDYLAAHSALPVPRVLHADDALLLIELLATDGALDAAAEADAADHLAALHGVTGPAFGLERDTLIGGLAQPNGELTSWRAFFAERRLVHMAAEGERADRLPAATRTRVERLAGRLERWLDEPPAPSLVHGDVWGGNVLCRRTVAGNRIAGFIDPAIYYADPEVELAFATLFNTFGEAFFARYREHRPLAPGFFEARRDLYNLYPLLVHVRLFGAGYLGAVERTLAHFGA